LAYWEKSIFQRRPGGNWHMILQHNGERRKLSLKTDNKVAAIVLARDTYLKVLSNGWEEAFQPSLPPLLEVTVGQFLSELASKADLKPQTLKGYAIAFRSIIEDIFDLDDGGNEKFDYRSGGHARWLEKIHANPACRRHPGKGSGMETGVHRPGR
jgi:hypothetical protein